MMEIGGEKVNVDGFSSKICFGMSLSNNYTAFVGLDGGGDLEMRNRREYE